MAGFHLTRRGPDAAARLAAAEARFRSHGFTQFEPIATAAHQGFHVHYIHGGPETFFRRGGDFVAVAGTLSYRDRLGREALAGLLDDFALPFERWDELRGQFALVVHKGGQTALVGDYLGAFQLFHDPDWSTVSTSFLATCEAQARLRWADQGVYEFAFNVFPIGDDTVFEEVRRLGPERQVRLGEQAEFHAVSKPLPVQSETMPIEERIERSAHALASIAAPYVAFYGDRMQVPLSGGLDSRLALGLLRSAGVRPHVYVYGAPSDIDARIATAIGEAEGFPVEVFHKAAFAQITPDAFPAIVERNFFETDALVTDGGLFDNGGNAAARHARQAGGQLAVSGGCGEVFRNFFYLSDRSFRAREVALAFFSRFIAADVTSRFSARGFLSGIAAKLAQAVGAEPDDPLSRTVVEQLYPRVRCRAFFGREISLVARHGGYFMPFLHRRVVIEALRVPMPLKTAGRFEAMLLNRIDPSLARHMSAYGHSFAEPPSRDHLMSERSTVVRPPWLRQKSYWLRRKLAPMGDEHGGLLTPIYMGRVIDLHFPHMQAFFNVGRVADRGLYRRIATLEYLGQHLEGRLAA